MGPTEGVGGLDPETLRLGFRQMWGQRARGEGGVSRGKEWETLGDRDQITSRGQARRGGAARV